LSASGRYRADPATLDLLRHLRWAALRECD